MTVKRLLIVFIPFLTLTTTIGWAQKQTAKIGTIVSQVEVRDSSDEPISLPHFGEKHLLIFYPDPDHANQNKKFIAELEKNRIKGSNIYSFGVTNLKDAPLLPNSVVRSMIRKREKKTGATIYTDPNYILRDAWGLGDVNNLFTIIFVTKEGEIAFLKKGELTDSDIKEFYEVIDKYGDE